MISKNNLEHFSFFGHLSFFRGVVILTSHLGII